MIKAIVNQLTLEQIKTHRYEQLHLLTVNQTKYFYSTFCSHDLQARKNIRSNRWVRISLCVTWPILDQKWPVWAFLAIAADELWWIGHFCSIIGCFRLHFGLVSTIIGPLAFWYRPNSSRKLRFLPWISMGLLEFKKSVSICVLMCIYWWYCLWVRWHVVGLRSLLTLSCEIFPAESSTFSYSD